MQHQWKQQRIDAIKSKYDDSNCKDADKGEIGEPTGTLETAYTKVASLRTLNTEMMNAEVWMSLTAQNDIWQQ